MAESVDITRRAVLQGSIVASAAVVPAMALAENFDTEELLAPPNSDPVTTYAAHVVGNSMMPRYFDGEIVYADTSRVPEKFDYVVALIKPEDGSEKPLAYIKSLYQWDESGLVLAQFHPGKYLQFPADRVLSVDKIIMSGERRP